MVHNNRMKIKEVDSKRGLSPVIATTLLIAMVIVIGLIIFLWFRGMVGDYGEKFGKNIELACEDVVLGTSYDDGSGVLYITNDGNVPVFNMNVKISKPGSHETKDLSDLADGWPETGLGQGGVFSEAITLSGNPNKITLIPVLIGTSDKGKKKKFICNERYGYEIAL